MRIRMFVAAALVGGAAIAVMPFVAAQGQQPDVSMAELQAAVRADTGVGQYYTAAQAIRGETLYNRHCGYCHVTDPKNRNATRITGVGGGSLGGRYLQKTVEGNPRYPSAYYLFKRMEYMPPNDVESVTPQQRADILAYIFRQSGLAPGTSELTADYGKMQAMPLPAEPGFAHIFNGRDFSGISFLLGYHCTAPPEGCSRTDPTGIVSVKDGVLKTTGRIHGFIQFAKKYKNFTLRMEQRIAAPWHDDLDDLVQDQTGIMIFLGSKGGPIRPWGSNYIEVEGKYHELLSIYGGGEIRVTGTVDREARRRVINPANQWQRLEISARDGMLKCSLNGTLIATAPLPADLDPGYIAFQSQGGPIEWRNIRIKEE